MRKAGLIVIGFVFTFLITRCGSGVSSEKMEAGKKVYTTNCGGCHMENGMGAPRMNPALVNSPYVMGHPASLIELVLRGSDFFGATKRSYNNQMASFHNLKDEEIADLLTYVRNNFAKTGDEISVEEVKEVRANLK
jgi:mono/diheme cytochrome c family protein